MKGAVVTIAIAVSFMGCSTLEPQKTIHTRADVETGKYPVERQGYLDEGPTVTMDVAEPKTAKTTLALLEERVQEITELKVQVEALEKAKQEAEAKIEANEKSASSTNAEAERLRSMLEHAISEQKDLSDEVLKTRIARLRLEQDLLRLRLADLVKDAP